MAHIAKRDFEVLDVSGQKYPQWKDDIVAHLGAMGLEHTIEEGSWATHQEKHKAHIFIRHHMSEALKNEYIRVRDPNNLLKHLEVRFGHHHDVLLPRLREEWKNLRFQNFTSVNEYNSALFQLCSQLEYCGEEVFDFAKLDKTFSTMGGPNLHYARQLRQDKFTKFTDLIAVLLLSEQHDKILLKNDNIRPSGSTAIPEANAIAKFGHGRWNNKRGCGKGRGRGPDRKYNNFKKPRFEKKFTHQERVSKPKGACLKCGLNGHWARACRTPKHFVDLYQASIKHGNKGPEAHFISDAIPLTSCMPTSNTLDIADYLLDDIAGSSESLK
ncbi:hypothetical protein RND81_10G175100 [Saponaria officinalis]|uniref:CCHC-type domain-containing protein n=1 Tax=Saponaria officinalis TaxID=3572 RepID=A0AAW1I5S2_SAPOF